MTTGNVSELSTTASVNTDFNGVSVLGSAPISLGDDAFRNVGAFMAKWWSDLGGVNTVTGTGDAIAVTTPTGYSALKSGMRFQFIAGAANTGAATLNFDAIGAKAVRKVVGGVDVALAAGDIPGAKSRVDVVYDATANGAAGAWVLVGTLGGITASAVAALYLAIANVMTAAQFIANAASKVLTTDTVWAAAVPVSLGGSLTGNISLDFSTFINGYGTATGAITFNAATNVKTQSGTIEITASAADRTVAFNATVFTTPNGASLGTVLNGTTVAFSYAKLQTGKVLIVRMGTV